MGEGLGDFKIYSKNIDEENELYIIDIKSINEELTQILDKYFISICEGDSENNINFVKKRVFKFLEAKNKNMKMGSISEFLIHLFLNNYEFKQECLFFNLEEESLKKGFDGYYSKNGVEWIMESKAGNISTKNISHSNKIVEAYKDLKDKFEGKVKNNPWQNAYSHASHCDVGTDKTIRRHIQQLSNDFYNNKVQDISKFNIIPGATIFLNDDWINTDIENITQQVKKVSERFQFNKIIFICITKRSLELFISFLNINS